MRFAPSSNSRNETRVLEKDQDKDDEKNQYPKNINSIECEN